MKKYSVKTIRLSDLERQVENELILQADMFHPCDYDYDNDIIISESGELLDGHHRAAGLVAYCRNQMHVCEDVHIQVVTVHPKARCIGIIGDNWHRAHNSVVQEVVRLAHLS